jgi:ubiquinone/menaquinone biosynthesis C-methylase UbiE
MTARNRSSALFDRWSVTYDDPTLQRFTYRPIHDAVLARVDGTEPGTLVDLGCGTGRLTQRLLRSFPDATVVGVDLSGGMLTEAAARLRGAAGEAGPLVQADAQQLPFAASTVDLVVCTESFHWYPDQARTLSELARVLHPGGRLLIASIATLTGAGDRLLRRATGAGGRTVRALPPQRMRQLLTGSGFEVIHQRRIPRLGLLAWPVLTDARRT